MKRTKSVKLFQNPMISGIVCCVLFAGVLTAAAAGMLLAGILPQTSLQESAMLSSALTTLIACLISVKKAKNKKILYSMSIWAGFMILLIIGNLLFLKDGSWNVLPILLSSGAGTICGGILTVTGKGNRKRRMR